MAITLEEAKKKLNQDLAKQRKGYLSENAYRQSPEFKEKAKTRIKNFGKEALEYTPYAIYSGGKQALKDIEKGDYGGAAVEGTFAVLSAIPGAMLAKKGIQSGYQGLKNLFKGPLSPQYNSDGGAVYAAKGAGKEVVKNFISRFFDHPMNEAIRKNKPEFKDLDIYYTGQNPAIAKEMLKGKTKGDVYFSDNPEVAKEYAGSKGVVLGFGAKTPISGKRSIIDKNMGYAGGQTQYVLSPDEAIKFMQNPTAGPMPFSIFSNPQLTRR